MKVSSKLECACRALLQLEKNYATGQVIKIEDIAAKENLSANFLLQVLKPLKAAGLVESKRGQAGGYFLSKDPSLLTLKDIYLATEGAPLNASSPLSRGNNGADRGESDSQLEQLWINVSADLSETLSSWTLLKIKEQGLEIDSYQI